ncbi:unnamed protein product [Withania somnifera]
MSNFDRGKELVEGSSRSPRDQPATLSRYESQKRRDWNTFGHNHVLEFLRYLDQFGKTKVHLQGCIFYGQPEPPAPCTCPAAYEENGGSPEMNPFASGTIRVYLREVKECQSKARGIPYKKKKKKVGASESKGDDDSASSHPFS